MLHLTPMGVDNEFCDGNLPAGGRRAGYRSSFGKRNLRQNNSGSCSKVAKLAHSTPIGSFEVARDVRESKSTFAIDTYASEAVKGSIASLFNGKPPYALKLGDEPILHEAVQSLFSLINDYVPTVTKSKDKPDWK